jgi:hypothetical protein
MSENFASKGPESGPLRRKDGSEAGEILIPAESTKIGQMVYGKKVRELNGPTFTGYEITSFSNNYFPTAMIGDVMPKGLLGYGLGDTLKERYISESAKKRGALIIKGIDEQMMAVGRVRFRGEAAEGVASRQYEQSTTQLFHRAFLRDMRLQ